MIQLHQRIAPDIIEVFMMVAGQQKFLTLTRDSEDEDWGGTIDFNGDLMDFTVPESGIIGTAGFMAALPDDEFDELVAWDVNEAAWDEDGDRFDAEVDTN